MIRKRRKITGLSIIKKEAGIRDCQKKEYYFLKVARELNQLERRN